MKQDDIEGLKKKYIVYKQTLETMKSGNVVEDYLIMKNECYDLMKQISKLEDVLETNRDQHTIKITNISQQITALKEVIKSMNLSIENVKQKVKGLTDKVNSLNMDELMAKMDSLIRNEETLLSSITQEKKELLDLKNELIKLKGEVLKSNIVPQKQIPQAKNKIQPTSYQQLQKIIKSSSTSYQNILPELSVPFGKDISNFYQGVSKRTQKASFLPPTSPKPQKIELIDQNKGKNKDLKEAESELLISTRNKTNEEKPKIFSETPNDPSINELSSKVLKGDVKSISSIQRSKVDE